jgi:hypothetical protein
MSTTTDPQFHVPSPESAHRRKTWLTVAGAIGGLTLATVLLSWIGRPLWSTYRDYRKISQQAEESAPIGYVGVSLRRTYLDKPTRFFDTSTGRKLLWAAKGPDGKPEFYDVTDAAFEVDKVAGGYGRDSIPGIDYPLFDLPGSGRTSNVHGGHRVVGMVYKDGPRSYPLDLLKKIEVVNDEADGRPFSIVFDRKSDRAWLYDRRLDGRPITFGTTGYAIGLAEDPKTGTPLLYDRKTRSLWLPEEAALICVNGSLKGTKQPAAHNPVVTTWSDWSGRHPQTSVLIGRQRDGDRKPIPIE